MARISSKILAQEGEKIYNERLKAIVEPQFNNMFIAIDVDTGDYFLDSNLLAAVKKGQEKYPDKIFYVRIVGDEMVMMAKAA